MSIRRLHLPRYNGISNRTLLLGLLITAATLLSVSHSAFAINWEGHDDWLTEEAYAHTLRSALPKATPIAKAFPLCAEREALHAHNHYEQRPIARINCIEPKDGTRQPVE